MTFIAKFKLQKQSPIKANFTVHKEDPIKATFKIDFRPSKVSQLENDLEYQTKQEVEAAIQTESDIINARIDGVDDRIDAIEEDVSTTINSITGDDLINVIRNDRSVQLHSATFVFEQGIASSEWLIVHNLNKRPSIHLVDSSGREFEAVKEYINNNQVIIRLGSATAGKAYLN